MCVSETELMWTHNARETTAESRDAVFTDSAFAIYLLVCRSVCLSHISALSRVQSCVR